MKAMARKPLTKSIRKSIDENQITVLVGHSGYGQIESILDATAHLKNWQTSLADGDWLSNGFLAGFEEFFDESLEWCAKNDQALVTQYQQTIKRLRPGYVTSSFTVPKDLTNTSTKEERTRFYHREYQNKLLVGLTEFFLKYLRARSQKQILVIDNASGASPTVVNLIKTIQRMPGSTDFLRFVLVDYDQSVFITSSNLVSVSPVSTDEALSAFPALAEYSPSKADDIYVTAKGNFHSIEAIIRCEEGGIPIIDYLTSSSLIDFFLSSLTPDNLHEMMLEFVNGHCKSKDAILQRNYKNYADDKVDQEHQRMHQKCMERYIKGEAPLILVHAISLRDKHARLTALADPSEMLKSIGLYDTWFSYFSEMFSDPELRRSGSGDDPTNAVFVNAAFVLYSLGCGAVSVPYLEEFYEEFTESRFIPTVLYAQSMTYGRYQLPVNLPLAEEYALRNLKIIDEKFTDYDKYHYIKVFAENAYAYIKARQGKFDEALELCTVGNQKMLDIYGDDRFKLHQSILIYNTSQVYEIIRDFDSAEAQLKLAQEYDPYYGEYFNDLGNLLSKVDGRESEALDAYAKAIDLCPPYHECHFNRGSFLAELGRDDEAMADFERSLVIKPRDPKALLAIGNIKLASGEFQSAIDAYQEALLSDPRNSDLLGNIGMAQSELGNGKLSVEHYEQAIAFNPKHSSSHNNLAIELYNLGEFDSAMKHADEACKLDDDPDYTATRKFIVENREQAYA